ncbi:hypothetical protein D3C72_1753800 [compost metagenome]
MASKLCGSTSVKEISVSATERCFGTSHLTDLIQIQDSESMLWKVLVVELMVLVKHYSLYFLVIIFHLIKVIPVEMFLVHHTVSIF